MATKTDIEFQITELTLMYDDFITYNDSINFTDENEKVYVTSDTILSNTKKSSETSIQQLQQEKIDSLIEYELITTEDTTLFNICFEIYGVLTDDNFDQLIVANDFEAFNRTDIDPNDPIIKRGTKLIYYK